MSFMGFFYKMFLLENFQLHIWFIIWLAHMSRADFPKVGDMTLLGGARKIHRRSFCLFS